VRSFLKRDKLAVAQLVQDASRILVPEVVDPAALPVGEHAQRRRREIGVERQGLQTREDAVPPEHGHEPRQAGGGQAVRRPGDGRREAQGSQIDKASLVRRL
jgi:hypothetical protein